MTYKFAIFDIDGTITRIKLDLQAKHPKLKTPNKLGEQEPIPGVPEKLAKLQQKGVKIALATNRGGVAWGYVSDSATQQLVQEAAEICGIPDVATYYCPYDVRAKGPRANREFAIDNNCRKPLPGMLVQAMQEAGFTPEDTVFVGDSPADQGAAAAAKVHFIWAKDYFFDSPN